MANTEAFTGSATIGTTEYSLPNASTTLTARTDVGTFQPFVDTSAIAAGDQFQFTVYEKVTSGGSQRVVYQAVLTGAMAASWVCPTLMLMNGWDVTVKKLAGTDRSLSWSIRKAG